LRLLNWRVLRIWEHALKNSSERKRILSRLKIALADNVIGR
jgi:hypothetical protein